MAPEIYLRRDGDLIQVREGYATKAQLQELVASHPALLPADGEPHRRLLVSRELGIRLSARHRVNLRRRRGTSRQS